MGAGPTRAGPPTRGQSHPRAADGHAGFVVGATDGSRLEIGRLAYGIEISGESRLPPDGPQRQARDRARQGDAFLRQLPGGNIEVPFEVSLVGSTSTGIHFEGGTGCGSTCRCRVAVRRVHRPVHRAGAGDGAGAVLEIRGGFSLTLGPFAASIDRVGMSLALQQLGDGIDHLDDFVRFAPPGASG